MSCLARKLTLCWMLATTAHLPVPICDGDDLGSAHRATDNMRSVAKTHDIDFVRLGCDAPDDPDDGPVDDDPDNGNSPLGMFPAYLISRDIDEYGAWHSLRDDWDVVHSDMRIGTMTEFLRGADTWHGTRPMQSAARLLVMRC